MLICENDFGFGDQELTICFVFHKVVEIYATHTTSIQSHFVTSFWQPLVPLSRKASEWSGISSVGGRQPAVSLIRHLSIEQLSHEQPPQRVSPPPCAGFVTVLSLPDFDLPTHQAAFDSAHLTRISHLCHRLKSENRAVPIDRIS